MTEVLPGDPASCSQSGGAMRSLASRLRVTGRRAHEAAASITTPGADRPRPTGAEIRALRRADAVDRAAAAATHELDQVGRALQDFATDLAELQAQYHRLVGRAGPAGLRVVGTSLVPVLGVAGLADRDALTTQEAARSALQSELDRVLRGLTQRRQRLLTVLHESQRQLGHHSAELRR